MIIDIPWAPGYGVSADGQAWCKLPLGRRYGRSEVDWRPLKLILNRRTTYIQVAFWIAGKRRSRTVHVLVMGAFGPPKPFDEAQIRHYDGNTANNAIENLLWGTRSENMQDKKRHGTDNSGERNPIAKFSNEEAMFIRMKYSLGCSRAELATEHGVAVGTIGQIVRRERYGAGSETEEKLLEDDAHQEETGW